MTQMREGSGGEGGGGRGEGRTGNLDNLVSCLVHQIPELSYNLASMSLMTSACIADVARIFCL